MVRTPLILSSSEDDSSSEENAALTKSSKNCHGWLDAPDDSDEEVHVLPRSGWFMELKL